MHRAFRGSNSKRFVYARKFLKPLRKVGIKFKRESYIMRRLGTIRLATWMTLSCSVFFVFVIAHHEQQGGEDAVANIESIKKVKLLLFISMETKLDIHFCIAAQEIVQCMTKRMTGLNILLKINFQ